MGSKRIEDELETASIDNARVLLRGKAEKWGSWRGIWEVKFVTVFQRGYFKACLCANGNDLVEREKLMMMGKCRRDVLEPPGARGGLALDRSAV